MTYEELLNSFEDMFPFAKYEDYRPICHKLFTDGKVGITLFFENGDIIEYYPASAKEQLDCNDCYYSMQNCKDKTICCEDETALCDNFEPVMERKVNEID